MKKQTVRMAVLTCTLAMSLTPVSAYALPGGQQQVSEGAEDAGTKAEGPEWLDGEGSDDESDEAGTAAEGLEDTEDIDRTAEWQDSRETGEDGSADVGEEPGADGTGDTAASRNQEPVSAKRLQEEKAEGPILVPAPLEDDVEEDILAPELEEEKPVYTAPEDTRHANVSFAMTEAASSAFFSQITYPVTIGLKEVDTGSRATLTVRSAGQILEVEKGDYAVVSVKDSGKVPLSVPGDTLHIYENTEYTVRFAANNALKLFTDFLTDNIFLAFFIAFAALFYKKAIIPRFASDVKRR